MANNWTCVAKYVLSFTLAITSLKGVLSASKEEWSSRVMYQILTDRFDKTNSDTEPCADLDTYCGGTFEGIRSRLDYISSLGADAIWISPIIENTANGYHGYYAKNLYKVNPYYGTEDDLKNLVKDAHERNMFVMVDVVVNHMGQGIEDIPTLYPFNESIHYHDCSCWEGDCCGGIDSCSVDDYANIKQMLHCRLFGLPDLNHDNEFVHTEFIKWIKYFVNEFQFDGIRLDTVPYVTEEFWTEFTQASGVFSIGEVSAKDFDWVASYVNKGDMDAVLHYPLYHRANHTFSGQSTFLEISEGLEYSEKVFGEENINYLGSFSENHDLDRFLTVRNDISAYQNMILFTLSAPGIPVVYYGQEQAANVGERDPLWTSGFETNNSPHGMYRYIQKILKFRKRSSYHNFPLKQIAVDDEFMAYSRGVAVIVLTNVGLEGANVERTLVGVDVPFTKGTVVCNVFNHNECTTVQKDNELDVTLVSGAPQILAPQQVMYLPTCSPYLMMLSWYKEYCYKLTYEK